MFQYILTKQIANDWSVLRLPLRGVCESLRTLACAVGGRGEMCVGVAGVLGLEAERAAGCGREGVILPSRPQPCRLRRKPRDDEVGPGDYFRLPVCRLRHPRKRAVLWMGGGFSGFRPQKGPFLRTELGFRHSVSETRPNS